MYNGKNAKVHVEEIKSGMMGGVKTGSIEDALNKFINTKNVLHYTVSVLNEQDRILLTIMYED